MCHLFDVLYLFVPTGCHNYESNAAWSGIRGTTAINNKKPKGWPIWHLYEENLQ